MPPVITRAVVLHTYPYGETSKIVRLATREHGVISVIAKGAHRPKANFGAKLQVLSEGMAQVYFKQSRDLQTLASFDVVALRHELANDIGRFAAAAALAELMIRSSTQEGQPEVFRVLQESLDWLVESDLDNLSVVSLVTMWSIIDALGYAPSLEGCAVDGASIEEGPVSFSITDGGLLCKDCARSRDHSRLDQHDRRALTAFVAGRLPDVEVSARHAAAHRRLLTRFVQRHIADGTDMPALAFWESLR